MHCVINIGVLLLAAGAALAQTDQLSNQSDANKYYADQERAAWSNNGTKLTSLDKAFSAAISELSKENSRRLQAIYSANRDAHKALAQQDLSPADRAAESQRIQAETAKERAELVSWYQQSRKEISAEHVAKRTAQTAATYELVDRIGQERIATLQRLINGPVPLSSLPPMTFPDETGGGPESLTSGGVVNDPSDGPTVSTGGIDVAGSVPLNSPGDELIANENAERYALYERLFNEEKERRRRAEEEAASQLQFIQTTQAQAHTIASASSPVS